MNPLPTVTLIGAGPGDPELLTIKAVKALRRATVALVDDLVHPGVLRYLRQSARIVHVGKRGGGVFAPAPLRTPARPGGSPSTPQAFIHKLMVAEARRGERVVRIKGGDPFVFGRGGEERDALRAAGIEVEVISGLTAGIAGPAAIGVPVTDRRYTRGVVLVTGHAGSDGGEPDWAALARCALTLVIYMGVARAPAIAHALLCAGMAAHTPVAVVCRAHLPQQRQALCTLGTLAQTLAALDLCSPAVLVVGDVVRASPLWQEPAVDAASQSTALEEGVELPLDEPGQLRPGAGFGVRDEAGCSPDLILLDVRRRQCAGADGLGVAARLG